MPSVTLLAARESVPEAPRRRVERVRPLALRRAAGWDRRGGSRLGIWRWGVRMLGDSSG